MIGSSNSECPVLFTSEQFEIIVSQFAFVTSEEIIQINYFVDIISLSYYILKQLFTSVSVASIGYLPRRFPAQ